MIRTYKILPHQIGLHFQNDQFVGVRHAGRHFVIAPFQNERIDVVSTREILLQHRLVTDIVRADRENNFLQGLATSLDLSDRQRALVWVDGRFFKVLGAGAHVLWTEARRVQIEVIDIESSKFEHEDLELITRHASAPDFVEVCDVQRDHVGVYFRNGRYVETLKSGRYAFWKKTANTRVLEIDMREKMLDVAGQDVMTADHVTLRLNAVVAYKVTDARAVIGASEDLHAALYREAQLALRDVIGGQTLDQLLGGKEQVAIEAQSRLEQRASEFGLAIVSVGVRDVVLPGEMKDLLNQVTAARKAAEANLISRREETAAIRSQANTAKLLDASPTLMRLRELEVLEKVAGSSNLQVLLNDGSSLSDRVTKLI
jgi:regulator of protease activity HflC (stomatin/prohibitin superfamily)